MNEATRLLRQIHPHFCQEGHVSSQAFRPTPKDEHLLSVYDGDQMDPRSAWEHFVRQPHCASLDVLGVTVAECDALALPVRPDPLPFPEHAVIDFSAYAKGQVERKAKQLRARAEERGWLYRPTAG